MGSNYLCFQTRTSSGKYNCKVGRLDYNIMQVCLPELMCEEYSLLKALSARYQTFLALCYFIRGKSSSVAESENCFSQEKLWGKCSVAFQIRNTIYLAD